MEDCVMTEKTEKPVLIKRSCRSKGADGSVSRLTDLMNAIQEMNENRFTGYIKINFSQGGIGRIEKYEEILRNGQAE